MFNPGAIASGLKVEMALVGHLPVEIPRIYLTDWPTVMPFYVPAGLTIPMRRRDLLFASARRRIADQIQRMLEPQFQAHFRSFFEHQQRKWRAEMIRDD